MTRVHILKPGCDPNVLHAGKTNLQLRELQMLQSALQSVNIESDILTVAKLANAYECMSGHSFIIFNSAACFNDELDSTIKLLTLLPNIQLIFVSNDCRLTFKTDNAAVWLRLSHRMQAKHDIRLFLLTNASAFLHDYAVKVMPTVQLALSAITMHAPLDMLPCMLQHTKQSVKTVDLVYPCMHFCDCDESRRRAMQYLADQFGDRIVFTGDMRGLTRNGEDVPSIVTDTKDVRQWYAPAKLAPVLLEDNYAVYGVMPNRLAEAICNECIPAILVDDAHACLYAQWPVVATEIGEYCQLLDQLCKANDAKRQAMLDQLESIKQRRLTTLLTMLKTIIY